MSEPTVDGLRQLATAGIAAQEACQALADAVRDLADERLTEAFARLERDIRHGRPENETA